MALTPMILGNPGWVNHLTYCVALDFVDLVAFERHQVLDDKRKGVNSFSDGLDTGSFEDEIAPWPGGAPVRSFDYALGLEFPQDSHLISDVWCQRLWARYRKFGNDVHVLFLD